MYVIYIQICLGAYKLQSSVRTDLQATIAYDHAPS